MLAVVAGQIMNFDSAEGHPVPSQKRVLLKKFRRWLVLNAKQVDLACKWSQLVTPAGRKTNFLQINESQSIWQWPATKSEAQIKTNQLPPKPIYDSFSERSKIQSVSLRNRHQRLHGDF